MTPNRTDFLPSFFRTVIGLENLLNFDPKPVSFPKFEILQNSEKNQYLIRVLLAGYEKTDISVSIDRGSLIVEHIKKEDGDVEDTHDGFVHVSEKVIARRAFKLGFKLTNNIELTEAKFENGILSIYLKENIADNKQIIEIS